MKKLMLAAALTLVPVAGFAYEGARADNPESLTQLAQADGPGAHKGKRGKRGMGKHHGRHGKAKLRMMVKVLKDVGVSDDQLAAIKKDLEAQKPAMEKLRAQAKAARKTGDPILMQEAQLKLAEKRLEMTTDVRKHVTDQQWAAAIAKLKEKRKERMERRMERMQGQLDELE